MGNALRFQKITARPEKERKESMKLHKTWEGESRQGYIRGERPRSERKDSSVQHLLKQDISALVRIRHFCLGLTRQKDKG